jgi:hypothetical protein
MKRGLLILMIIAMMLHAFSFVMIYISFKIHQDYIITNLCIQRDATVNACHGHCQLTKKMKDHEKKQNDNPLAQEGWLNFCFIQPQYRYHFELMLSQIQKRRSFNQSLYLSAFTNKIFHPPK